MESLDESKLSSKMGFFKYLFKFDEDIKGELLNIIQYSVLAFIPIVILNKSMQKFVPEADEDKGSVEILAEVLIQIIIMFIGIFYTNRIITYIPTYSGEKYPVISITYIILAVLLITMSLQTKLGEKVSILYDRVIELWEGTSGQNKKGKKGKKGNVKVSQPFSNQISSPVQQAQNQSLNSNDGTTSIYNLPSESQQPQQYQQQHQQQQQGTNSGQNEMFGGNQIMAANEALGGSAFGANF